MFLLSMARHLARVEAKTQFPGVVVELPVTTTTHHLGAVAARERTAPTQRLRCGAAVARTLSAVAIHMSPPLAHAVIPAEAAVAKSGMTRLMFAHLVMDALLAAAGTEPAMDPSLLRHCSVATVLPIPGRPS